MGACLADLICNEAQFGPPILEINERFRQALNIIWKRCMSYYGYLKHQFICGYPSDE
jgi:hypothetical protein